jgi:hypothetical protein
LLIILQGFAIAEAPPSPVGEWVLTLGKRTLLILSIKPADGKSQPFSGSLSCPQHFHASDTSSFSNIQGGTEVEPIVASVWKDHSLSLTVQNPADPTAKDTYLLILKDDTHAQLQFEGSPLPSISLTRAHGPLSVATDWDPNTTYSPDDDAPSNTEMKRIFEEDQRVRQPDLKLDLATVRKSDAERRQATMKLLNEGALHTGEDFTWAAFLFQHGDTSNDYLLAHTLAMIAVKKGYGDALWIATATLDRYLQSIKQPQIYGTQFLIPKDLPTTQEPYDRTLISDALRSQLGVQSLSSQEEQSKQYDSQRKEIK